MKNTFFSLFVAVLSSAFAYVLLIFIKQYLGEDIPYSEKIYSVIIVTLVLFILLHFITKIFGWKLIKSIYSKEINEEINQKLKCYYEHLGDNQAGLEKSFSNMTEAMSEICQKLRESKNVSIFVQIGRDILSGKGVFYDCLMHNKEAERIRILHCSKNNPYLSEKRASERGRGKISEWHQELTSVDDTGKRISHDYAEGVFEKRFHHEGYLWRIFMFDDCCFVQPYIYESNNSDRAPVYKLLNAKNSVYNTFRDYFEFKWEENKPNIRYVNDLVRDSFPVAVTAILRFDSLYVFVVPKRYIEKGSIYVQAVGGKIEENENFKEALVREIFEEIGAKVKVHNSSYTTYIHEGANLWSWKLQDDPAPYCIYKRDSQDTRDKRVEWILLYQAELNISNIKELSPDNEADTIVCLSYSLLSKLISGTSPLTVNEINNATDGSRIISNNFYSPDTKLHPRGMVPVIGTSSHPRHGD